MRKSTGIPDKALEKKLLQIRADDKFKFELVRSL